MLLKLLREGLGRIIVIGDKLSRPSPVKRSPEEQARVEEAIQSLSIYQFYACPFCVKTRRALHRLNLPVVLRDAKEEPYRQELAEGGGRVKVPCMRIETESGVQWMYESDDIIEYLESRFNGELENVPA